MTALRFLTVMSAFALAALNACKPRSDTSKLWSEQAAEDFQHLVKKGRNVATHKNSNNTQAALQLDSSGNAAIPGYKDIAADYDSSNAVLTRIQFDTKQSPPVTVDQIEIEAQRLLYANAAKFGIDATELVPLSGNTFGVNWSIVRFGRKISGIPVRDARIDVIYGKGSSQWHLAEIRNRGWGKTVEDGAEQRSPLTREQLSQVTAMSDLQLIKTGVEYVPVTENSRTTLYLANWYKVRNEQDLEYTLTFSGEESPRLVEAFSHRADQTVLADAYDVSWADTSKIKLPLAGATYVGPNGQKIRLDDKGASSTAISGGKVELTSAFAQIHDANYSVAEVGLKQAGANWEANVTNETIGPVNVYANISRIQDFAKQFIGDQDTSYFKRRLRVITGITRNSQGQAARCNAFYWRADNSSTPSLYFYAAGGGCADMSTVNDVVMHEWGHGLDDHIGPGQSASGQAGGITDSAFSEGIGDIIPMLYSGSPKMGRGFFTTNKTASIRSAENQVTYQAGQRFEDTHEEGTIISGAFWELRKRMIQKYGEDAGAKRTAMLFFKHLVEVDAYEDSYAAVQRLADDDNNPATRHPDFCLINHAFAVKNLTPKDNCTEDHTPPKGLYLAILNNDKSESVAFLGSTENAAISTMGICKSKSACSVPQVTLKFLSNKNGRRIFGSNQALAVTAGETIQILGIDTSGKVIERRSVRLLKN